MYQEMLDTTRKDIIVPMIGLAGMHMCRHKWDQAEKLLMEAGPLCITKEHLCEVGDCLSGVYAATERKKEGLETLKQVLAIRKTLKDAEQHVTWRAMNNLAGAHADIGRFKEVVDLAREANEACNRDLGKNHPYTLQFKSNRGAYLIELGKIDEADKMLHETWRVQHGVMSEKHEQTLSSMYKGAKVMYIKGEYQDAVKTVG
jgi:tetratricopeptide (TPR) repeat protein